jgi:hypothetical protein
MDKEKPNHGDEYTLEDHNATIKRFWSNNPDFREKHTRSTYERGVEEGKSGAPSDRSLTSPYYRTEGSIKDAYWKGFEHGKSGLDGSKTPPPLDGPSRGGDFGTPVIEHPKGGFNDPIYTKQRGYEGES